MSRAAAIIGTVSIVFLLAVIVQIHERKNVERSRARATDSAVAQTVDGTMPEISRPQGLAAFPSDPAAPVRIDDPFAGTEVLESRVYPADEEGQILTFKVVKTNLKYPFLHVEETQAPDPVTGEMKYLYRYGMVADHIHVRVHPGTAQAELATLADKYGATILKKMHATDTYLVQLSGHDLDAVRQALRDFSRETALIASADPDYLVQAGATTPNDPQYSSLWGMHNTGQAGGTVDADIDAPEAWDTTRGSRTVLVGIIDTGIDYTHPDLAANIWTNPGEIPGNGIDDDNNGMIDDIHGWDFYNDDSDPMDDHFHGTHCAGTIGAEGNNAAGVVGVCWQVTMAALKFLNSNGSGFSSDAMDAVYYATRNGFHLTSNSWGGGGYSQALKDAIDNAGASGRLFVAAAGNSAGNNDVTPHYPSSYTSTNIIAVASTDRFNSRSSFSCYGATSVDVGAPGSSILSTFPVISTAAMTAGGYPTSYATISGTSMATPHVSGLCALIKANSPAFTGTDIKSRIMGSTDPLAALAGKCVTGGRINAYRALQTPTFSVTPSVTSVAPGASMTVSWTTGGATYVKDWIALVPKGAPIGNYVWWKYTNGAVTGTATLLAPLVSRDYEFRYLPNNGYADVAVSVPVSVTRGFTLTATPTTAVAGDTLTVAWTAPAGQTSGTDWISLHAVGAKPTAYSGYKIPGGALSGSVTFTAPATPNSYEFRYFRNNSYVEMARSNIVQVNSAITLTATAAGRVLTATWNAPAGQTYARDWIGVYLNDASGRYFTSYKYTNGATSGTYAFMGAAGKSYKFRYYQNGTYTLVTSTGSVAATTAVASKNAKLSSLTTVGPDGMPGD